jgi:hypothetical protein
MYEAYMAVSMITIIQWDRRDQRNRNLELFSVAFLVPFMLFSQDRL